MGAGAGVALVHCSYHKCLTVYYKRVLDGLLHSVLRGRRGQYHHFDSKLGAFYARHRNYRVASVNNHAVDLERLGDYRITRFIRDPRDLIVSGYFYHRRGAEPWCHLPAKDVAAGQRQSAALLRGDESYSQLLQRVSEDDGLIAEMDFRRPHLESMQKWPANDDRILTLRYENVVGNEEASFSKLFLHYGMSWPERVIGRRLAERFKAARQSRDQHVRDPGSGQWRAVFSPRVTDAFAQRFGDLATSLGYPKD